jgi:OmpA-OmpF porin, OOP family
MKRLALSLLLPNTIVYSQAQTRVAIIGGVHSSSVNTKDDFPKDDYDARTGLHAGLLLDVPFSEKFSFQPSLQYVHKGWKTDVTPTFEQKVNYLELPLNFVFKAPLGSGNTKFIIGAGPYVSALISGKEIISGTETDELPKGDGVGKYKGFDYGFDALAGFEFGRLFITANYSQGLNDFYRPANYSGDYKHRVIGGTIGFFLNRGTPKIRDKDNDGVVDAEDECPEEPGTALTKGCPDRDGDGIADKDDKCPDTAGIAKYNGCPIPDRDNDGVNDEMDKCPDTPGLEKYNGCPIPDSDNDGVNDEEDKCPSVAGLARYNGCPIPDTDNDGINDEEDKCPNLAGTSANNGCPEISPKLGVRVTSAANRVTFSSNSSTTLTSNAKKSLDEVAMIMEENPDMKLTVGGHTVSGGNEDNNMTLTQNRADAVKDYLVEKGISADRITTQGFGSSQPIASGTSSKNRRIELKLGYQ